MLARRAVDPRVHDDSFPVFQVLVLLLLDGKRTSFEFKSGAASSDLLSVCDWRTVENGEL